MTRDVYSESGEWGALLGDCLDRVGELPEGCADLVVMDPPYGTMKGITNMVAWGPGAMDWDDAIPPADLLAMVTYLLRNNGKAVIFSQEPYTSRLTLCQDAPGLPYSYRCAWKKNSPGVCLGAKKAPVSYFEDILLFSRLHPKHDFQGMDPSRPYFARLQEWLGLSLKQINALHGHRRLEHTFYHGSSQFQLCSRELYLELTALHGLRDWEGFTDWEDLNVQSRAYREELIRSMNEDFPSVFNLPEGSKSKSNIFEFPKDSGGFHPTQKPVALLEDLIQTFSRPGDLVVDFTAGSFSTGVAALRTGRRFVGVERDPGFFEKGVQRLQAAESPA